MTKHLSIGQSTIPLIYMFREIIIPKNNEDLFSEVLHTLDFKKTLSIYNFNDYFKKNIKKNIWEINNVVGLIISHENLNQINQQSKLLVAKSSENDIPFIESKKVKLIYGFEELHHKDYLHQRASGLNHTICKLAQQNNVAIGFSYNSLLNKNAQNNHLLIGRMMQNIRLCQKYKVKIMIGSFSENPYSLRSPSDIASMFKLLGMDGRVITDSICSDI